ncbi:MAG: phasin family protein [Chitinivorax sp.]|jgi:phasin family protein
MVNVEKLAELNEAGLNKAIRVSNIALAGIERLVSLQIEVTKAVISESTENAKALAQIKDVQGLVSLQSNLSQPALDKAMSVAKSFYEAASATQAELSKLVEEEMNAASKSTAGILENLQKYAPAGSDTAMSAIKSAIAAASSAYDTVTKTAQKVASELAEAGVNAATTSAKAAATASNAAAARPAAKKAATEN